MDYPRPETIVEFRGRTSQMAKHVDYLVLGQGLAGSLVAWELMRRERSVCVLDNPAHVPTTRIAAGVVNPIVGQRLALNWRVQGLLPVARALYAELEAELGVPLFRELPCYRVFANPGERDQWERRVQEPAMSAFAGPVEPSGRLGGYINDRYGGFSIRGAGMLDTAVFLNMMRRAFEARDCLRVGRYRQEAAGQISGPFSCQDVTADNIICCTGHCGMHQPLWKGIPFQPTKGEILMVRIPGLPQTLIVGRSVFILPMGNGLFRVGATFDWSDLEPAITEAGRQELEGRLRELLSTPFDVIDQQASIRPATRRRTPVLGRHPDYPAYVVFNGLGSKGVLTAPYFAAHLADYLVHGAELDREVDIRTHWKPAA